MNMDHSMMMTSAMTAMTSMSPTAAATGGMAMPSGTDGASGHSGMGGMGGMDMGGACKISVSRVVCDTRQRSRLMLL
jgi:hypothetical protein